MPALSVAVWNLHWGRGRAPRREHATGPPFDVVGPLLAADADVLVLPEHFRDHDGFGIADPLARHGYAFVELPVVRLSFESHPRVETPGDGWWTLLVASRLPILDHALLPIGRGVHDPAGARAAVRVTVDAHGVTLPIFGLHASSKLWWANPVRHLRGVARHLRDVDGPAVVAGDCNLWGPLVERLLPGWRRAVLGRTYPAHRPHSQIDHVLVRGGVTPLGGAVLAPAGSDHRAIRARLDLPLRSD